MSGSVRHRWGGLTFQLVAKDGDFFHVGRESLQRHLARHDGINGSHYFAIFGQQSQLGFVNKVLGKLVFYFQI